MLEADVRDTDKIPLDGIDAIIHLASVANDPCGDLVTKQHALRYHFGLVVLRNRRQS